ncbi:MAG: hypothetical protein EZS28_045111, partial [Streblomastix strix]
MPTTAETILDSETGAQSNDKPYIPQQLDVDIPQEASLVITHIPAWDSSPISHYPIIKLKTKRINSCWLYVPMDPTGSEEEANSIAASFQSRNDDDQSNMMQKDDDGNLISKANIQSKMTSENNIRENKNSSLVAQTQKPTYNLFEIHIDAPRGYRLTVTSCPSVTVTNQYITYPIPQSSISYSSNQFEGEPGSQAPNSLIQDSQQQQQQGSGFQFDSIKPEDITVIGTQADKKSKTLTQGQPVWSFQQRIVKYNIEGSEIKYVPLFTGTEDDVVQQVKSEDQKDKKQGQQRGGKGRKDLQRNVNQQINTSDANLKPAQIADKDVIDDQQKQEDDGTTQQNATIQTNGTSLQVPVKQVLPFPPKVSIDFTYSFNVMSKAPVLFERVFLLDSFTAIIPYKALSLEEQIKLPSLQQTNSQPDTDLKPGSPQKVEVTDESTSQNEKIQ